MNSTQEQQNSCYTVFPRDIVCLRNININTLHKGNDDDDDDNNNNNNKLGLKSPHFMLMQKPSSFLTEDTVRPQYKG